MGDVQKTACSSPLIDLTYDNASSSHHITQCFNVTRSDDKDASRIPELIDLTDDDDVQHFNPNIPVIDLTCDNEQFMNNRIPVIDLTNDDVQDTIYQSQCIDLIYNDASISNHTIRNFDLERMNANDIDHSPKLIDLTDEDNDFNPNISVIDLTCDNDQLMNSRIQDIDTIDDDVQDVTHLLANYDLTHRKQEKINDCIPAIGITNQIYQSIDQIIQSSDLTTDKVYFYNRRPVIEPILNDDDGIEKSVNDVEMNDLSSDNSFTSFPNDNIKNNPKISVENANYNLTANDLKGNETLNMNIIQNHPFSFMTKFNQRQFLANQLQENKFEGREEYVLTNHQLTKDCKRESLSSGKFEKIYQDNAPDFLEPAHHPIPLRHSLGRSTVTTSQNVPIEYTEDQSCTLTVSSINRRKKLKSNGGISRNNRQNTSKPSTSGENPFSFEAFKGFFQKFCIFLLLICFILYYWI